MRNYPCCIPGLKETPNKVIVHPWFYGVLPIYNNLDSNKPLLQNFQVNSTNPYDTWFELPSGDQGEWNAVQSTTLTRDLEITGQWSHIPDDYYQFPTNPLLRWIVCIEVGNDLWIGGWELGLQATWETDAWGNSQITFSGNTQRGMIRTSDYLKAWITANTVCDTSCGPYLCENVQSTVRLFTINDCLVIDFMNAICE